VIYHREIFERKPRKEAIKNPGRAGERARDGADDSAGELAELLLSDWAEYLGLLQQRSIG
jgi:hypothetical protein